MKRKKILAYLSTSALTIAVGFLLLLVLNVIVVNLKIHYKHFDHVGVYSEEIAWATVEGLFGHPRGGYIDHAGNVVIEFQFSDVSPFKDGLASVSYNTKDYGYINHHGNWAIAPIYNSAHDFYEKRAKVSFDNACWYFIDTEGNILGKVPD